MNGNDSIIHTDNGITTARFKTKAGNELRVFYNAATGLLVVDLNHAERAGGNELIRRTLNEATLLKHCAKLPKWADA